MWRARSVLLAVAVAAGCGSSNGTAPDAGPKALKPPAPIKDGLPSTCSPARPRHLRGAVANAINLVKDPSTATGYKFDLQSETLPTPMPAGTPLDPTRWNMADGFFARGPDADLLRGAHRPDVARARDRLAEESVQKGAATVLVDMTTHELVAHFSGVDANATHPVDHQALIITPATRLLPGRRYAVAITKAIRTTTGGQPTPPPMFETIAAGNPPDDPLSKAEAARMPEILAALEAAGVAKSDLVEAWDFITGSDEYLTGHVLSMRDQGLAMVGPKGAGYTVTEVDENLDGEVFRRVLGTFTVPQFIDNADETKPEAELHFDDKGNPILMGSYQAPFTILIPNVPASQFPLPIIVDGHGFLGNGEEELGDASGLYVQDFVSSQGYVIVATDWIGLSSHEDPADSGSNNALSYALQDPNDLPWITTGCSRPSSTRWCSSARW